MPDSTAISIIQLPRLSANGALSLGEQLISAAKPYKTTAPPSIQKALKRFTASHAAIGVTLRDQITLQSNASNSEAVENDRWEDACWSGLDDGLHGLLKLSRLPQSKEAKELQGLIFNDGLKFIQLPFMLQWAESETRIERIKSLGLQPRLEALGLGIFLSEIKKAHAAYGKSLGITAPKEPEKEAKRVRDALDVFGDRLREYIVKVIGHVEPDEPQSQALADALLLPYKNWNVGASAKTEEPKEEQTEASEG